MCQPMPICDSSDTMSASIRSTISKSCSRVSDSNSITSSTRLRNSGRNSSLSAESILALTPPSVFIKPNPDAEPTLVPAFDVMMMMVFSKLISLP